MIAMTIMLAAGLDVWQLVLTLGVFASTLLLMLTLFSQPGEIRISPQREAALLAGNVDRKTVFENPLLRPLMWLLLMLSTSLSMVGFKDWVRRTLVAAGSPDYYTSEEYIALSMLTGLMTGLMMGLLSMVFSGGQVGFFWVVVGWLVGGGLSLLQLRSKATTRLRAIARQIPYSLDLVSLAMGAGATFVEAVQTVVGEEVDDDPFNDELRALLSEMDLGTTRRRALENMADRIPIQQLHAIISSVVQAEELGTPLADVLHSQATLLRLQRSVRAENLAADASVKILVPCLLILMAVILAVFAPWILSGSKTGWL
jgi:tight adherence protein C